MTSDQRQNCIHLFCVDNDNMGGSADGRACDFGSKRWTSTGSIGGLQDITRTIAHELGHNLGLYHAFSRTDYDTLCSPSFPKRGTTDRNMDYSSVDNGSRNLVSCPPVLNGVILRGRRMEFTPCEIAHMHTQIANNTGSLLDIVAKDYCEYHSDATIHIGNLNT